MAGDVSMEGVEAAVTPGGDSDGHRSLQAMASANSMWYPSPAGGLGAQAQAPMPDGTLVTLLGLATCKGFDGVHGVARGPVAQWHQTGDRTPIQIHLAGKRDVVKNQHIRIAQP
eukprot:1285276-Karenia_brevis.AAC.1